MFGSSLNVAKSEITCKLAMERIKLQRNKKLILIKQYRKEVADLMRSGKQEYARIRVEGAIRENQMLQAFEILELYLALISVRLQLMSKTKEIPRDMIEGVSSIIYAAQRISDVPELTQLRKLFSDKYGKEYVMEAGGDTTAGKWQVNQNLMHCLLVEPPLPEQKLQVLSEIVQEYGVEGVDLAALAKELLPAPLAAGAYEPRPLDVSAMYAPRPAVAPAPPPPPPPGVPAFPFMSGPGYTEPAQQQPQRPQQPPPPPPLGTASYGSVQAAAEAAMASAGHAKEAAEYAARMYAAQGRAGPSNGAGPSGSAPPLVWPPADQAWPQSADGNDVGALQPADTSGYRELSQEDLQRNYDNAIGPPTKKKSDLAPPPSAPPPQPSSAPGLDSISFPPKPPTFPPTPPTYGPAAPSVPPDALPAPPPEAEDEYEALTRRLDALKKS